MWALLSALRSIMIFLVLRIDWFYLERGSVVEALVLDVAKAEWLVDLSVKQEFINRYKERSSTSHSNKFLFKKYLDYEKSQGDEERIEPVKQKAMEYIENVILFLFFWQYFTLDDTCCILRFLSTSFVKRFCWLQLVWRMLQLFIHIFMLLFQSGRSSIKRRHTSEQITTCTNYKF